MLNWKPLYSRFELVESKVGQRQIERCIKKEGRLDHFWTLFMSFPTFALRNGRFHMITYLQ